MNSEKSDFIEALVCLCLSFFSVKAERALDLFSNIGYPMLFILLVIFFYTVSSSWFGYFSLGIFEKSPELHGSFIISFALALRIDT